MIPVGVEAVKNGRNAIIQSSLLDLSYRKNI
jgi:hypothetical protein